MELHDSPVINTKTKLFSFTVIVNFILILTAIQKNEWQQHNQNNNHNNHHQSSRDNNQTRLMNPSKPAHHQIMATTGKTVTIIPTAIFLSPQQHEQINYFYRQQEQASQNRTEFSNSVDDDKDDLK